MNRAKLLTALAGALACALPCPPLAAQSPLSSEAAAKEQKRAEQALKLLDEAVADVRSLKIVENRVRLTGLAADALWAVDAQRARTLLAEAAETLTARFKIADDSPGRSLDTARRDLRQQLVETLAACDPQAALDFLRATRPPPQSGAAEQEAYNERRLINTINARDPAKMLRAAEEDLEAGKWSGLIETAMRAQGKDHDAAARFVEQAVTKLREKKWEGDAQAVSFVNLLLNHELRARAAQSEQAASRQAKPLTDERGLRALAEAAASAAVRAASNLHAAGEPERQAARELLATMHRLMPDVRKYAPAYAGTLQEKLAEYLKVADTHEKEVLEVNYVSRNGTVEDLIEAAKKVNEERRNSYYFYIIERLVVYQGEVERARRLVMENFPTPHIREEKLRLLEWLAAQVAAGRGQFGEMAKSLARLGSDAERVETLAGLATHFAKQGKTAVARELLERAEGYLGPRVRTIRQIEAQNRLMQAYALVEPERNFALIAPVLAKLDEWVAATVVASGFEQQGLYYSLRGESLLHLRSSYRPTEDCLEQLALLARLDFERARALADVLRQPELRAAARLYAARGALNAPPSEARQD
jgi:hypothetical protein